MTRLTRTSLSAAVAATLLLTTSACDNNSVKDTLGLSRAAPDEFRVVSRPPLSVPPEFNLRPPLDGSDAQAERYGIAPADATAREVITGRSAGMGDASAQTTAKAAFLNRVGAGSADPNIRDKLNAEAPPNTKDMGFFEAVRATEKAEPLVDAGKERERLKDNKQTDTPVNVGDVPTEKPKDRGWLRDLF